MDTVDLIIKSATAFYDELRADANGRYRSWDATSAFMTHGTIPLPIMII